MGAKLQARVTSSTGPIRDEYLQVFVLVFGGQVMKGSHLQLEEQASHHLLVAPKRFGQLTDTIVGQGFP
jgi:hypothetical protein